MRRTSDSHTLRRLALAALLALAMRALIPLGYMPGNVLAGEFMVLCPTGLPAGFLVDEEHQHHDHHDRGMVDADRACPIGTSLKYAAAAPPDIAVAPDVFHAHDVPDVVLRVFHDSQPSRPFQPRAPPRVAA
ncbi:MAG: DUF2946 family protein [Pseudomonadota bacterium]